ncbi:major facilitator superfamily domain-containing protein 5 [Periconia macrospinosa]|uniref:Molybdate-anion transporter n=1 Tax=Periconia macrospinosa TaxID=97972 RepID=A0A2V1DI71_9PLEO|nr:major facilitator superfamily domain-containing protein 5 [Periconia macrospinosa]
MDLYRSTFLCLLALNGVALYRSWRTKTVTPPPSPTRAENEKADVVEHRGRGSDVDAQRVSRLKWKFVPVFLLVNGADWLQGPYIYPIYKDEKGLEETLVALLFMIGFLSGGISASFAGSFADRFGRKAACMVYCVIYSLSCLTLLSDRVPVLFLGRVLGGICGTLLYSVYESWLVAEFNQLMLEDPGSILSGIFSLNTTLNSVVAIAAGIAAEWMVRFFGTAKAPFMGSIVCLSIAFVAIAKTWSENYGAAWDDDSIEATNLLSAEDGKEPTPTKSAVSMVVKDKNILTLALTSCFFEGSLFLFIFFKFPALKLCHQMSGASGDLPFGLIFAILMCSMMFGSMLYNSISASSSTPAKQVLIYTLAAASACFFLPAYIRDEHITLWCFCIFEVCCGLYYPAMSSLKGKLVEDSARASVYTILRVPLNTFVVLALSMTKEGEGHRNKVFVMCSGLIVCAALVVHRVLVA